MNIRKLLEQLANILPTEGRSSMASKFQVIREILLSNPADSELSVNKVEELLILAITSATDKKVRNTYRLALKFVLYHRGHFSDELGTLERALLSVPYNVPIFNPSNNNSIYPTDDPRLWAFINKIRFKIADCVDQRTTPTTKMEDKYLELLQILTALKEKYERLGLDPLDECYANELDVTTKFHRFKLDYIKKCLSTIREFRVLKTSVEHSLWASAVYQALEDLRSVKSEEFKKTLPGREDQKSEILARIIEMHCNRLNYYTHRSKLLLEPLGFFAEDQLFTQAALQSSLSIRRKRNATQTITFEDLKTQATNLMGKKSLEDIRLFTEAQALILRHQSNPQELRRVFNLAAQLSENKNPLSKLIVICALTLMESPTKERWTQYYAELQDIPIPACWRFKVAELWVCLSEFFSSCDSSNSFYRDCAIQCARQVNDRFGTKADLMSKLRLARIYNEYQEALAYKKELDELTFDPAATSPSAETFSYPKSSQHFLCVFKSKSTLMKSEQSDLSPVTQYCELIRDNYPFGLECMIQWLQNPTAAEYPDIVAAVESQHGRRSSNPLTLCQKVLRPTAYNRYLRIWGPIYCAVLENAYLRDQTDAWLAQGLTPNDIKVKLFTEVRAQLYEVLYHREILVPGAYDFLTSLDTQIYSVQNHFIETLETNHGAKELAFCRNRPGLRHYLFAEEALRVENWVVAELLAKQSIIRAKPAASPRNQLKSKSDSANGDTPSASPRQSVNSTDGTDASKQSNTLPIEIPKKLGPRRLFSLSKQRLTEVPRTSTPGGELGSKQSDKDPSATTTDGEKKDSSPTKKATSPRSTAPITLLDLSVMPANTELSPLNSPHSSIGDPNGDNPITLGYLILAIILWNKSLNRNKNRKQTDIDTFTDHLKSAREARVLVELYYLKGMIWWYYFDSGFDELWLTEEDKLLFQDTLDTISEPRRKKLHGDINRMRDYTAIKLAKSYFLRALIKDPKEKNPYFQMFPPAAVAYERFLWMQVVGFDQGTHLLKDSMRNLAALLRECIDTHGHVFAEYSLASILFKHIDFFRIEGSLADMYQAIQRYFHHAERFVIIEPGPKSDLERKVKELKQKEKAVAQFGLALNSANYPARESILAQINTEFDNPDVSSLRERLIEKLRNTWCTENLRQWFCVKHGCDSLLSDSNKGLTLRALVNRFELIIKSEFAHQDSSTLQKRIVAKFDSELSTLLQPLLSSLEDTKPDSTAHEKEEKTQPGIFYVAQLSGASRNIRTGVSNFLSQQRCSYPEEIFKPSLFTLAKLPLTLNYQSTHFTFTCAQTPMNDQSLCLQILSLDNNPDLLISLRECFEQAQQIYCYSKKVSLPKTKSLKSVENGFEVPHPDIVMLGIIRLIQRKLPSNRSNDPQIARLVELLEEAQSLDQQVWQWEGTPLQINAFLAAHQEQLLAAARSMAGRLSPGGSNGSHLSRGRHPHLANGTETHAVVSRRGSFTTPAGFSPVQPHKATLPSSSPPPEEKSSRDNKKGSLKLRRPVPSVGTPDDETSQRSRSSTYGSPPTVTGGGMSYK